MSRQLHFEYSYELTFSQPIRNQVFVLRCLPENRPGQNVLDLSLDLTPRVAVSVQTDGFGNRLLYGRADEPHWSFGYRVKGTVVTESKAADRTKGPAIYGYFTPLTQPDDAVLKRIRELSLPEDTEEKALALAEEIHRKMMYVPGTTDILTTAVQAFHEGKGVCQDFSHVFLMLARAAGLRARYVNGLVAGEGETHAWCQVETENGWLGIDPTRKCLTDDTYLVFNKGRDYADCPMDRGIFTGHCIQKSIARAVMY